MSFLSAPQAFLTIKTNPQPTIFCISNPVINCSLVFGIYCLSQKSFNRWKCMWGASYPCCGNFAICKAIQTVLDSVIFGIPGLGFRNSSTWDSRIKWLDSKFMRLLHYFMIGRGRIPDYWSQILYCCNCSSLLISPCLDSRFDLNKNTWTICSTSRTSKFSLMP